MQKAIIVDLDGVLANCDHRLHFIRDRKPKDWESFHNFCDKDTPNDWCVEILNRFDYDIYILIVSGRTNECYDKTVDWLNLYDIQYDLLVMREKDDYRNDDIFKREVYEKYIKDKYEVLFVLEDRKRVVDMWRSLSLVCLQPVDGNF